MTKTLYVGNLPWSVTDEELSEVFEAVANVKGSRVIVDRVTQKSRGFGFVEVAEDDVERVINSMNGTELKGRPLIVNEARPRHDRY
ncbi:MAG: RNA-binding protein [Firmicutes bacterium]|nr:RNA-binding protein [Bacillota bacterium]HXL05005.1 RNA-binding protein [Bacillota bacterium]